MSKWWWLGLLIAWLVFVIIGAALLGVWASQPTLDCSDSFESDYYFDDCSNRVLTPEYYGGLACIAIGGILHLAYWITLIVWCTKRRRTEMVPVSYAMETGPKPYGYPSPYQPVPETTPFVAPQPGRYCTNCGSMVTTQFCPSCGGRP